MANGNSPTWFVAFTHYFLPTIYWFMLYIFAPKFLALWQGEWKHYSGCYDTLCWLWRDRSMCVVWRAWDFGFRYSVPLLIFFFSWLRIMCMYVWMASILCANFCEGLWKPLAKCNTLLAQFKLCCRKIDLFLSTVSSCVHSVWIN